MEAAPESHLFIAEATPCADLRRRSNVSRIIKRPDLHPTCPDAPTDGRVPSGAVTLGTVCRANPGAPICKDAAKRTTISETTIRSVQSSLHNAQARSARTVEAALAATTVRTKLQCRALSDRLATMANADAP